MMNNAKPGFIFVCTKIGYNATPDHVKPERSPGKPVKHFEYSVPESWVVKGYVKEVRETPAPNNKTILPMSAK